MTENAFEAAGRDRAKRSEVVIDPRFNGPPGSANGGYTAGLLAAMFGHDHAVEVTLALPPPLGVPLALERDGEEVLMRAGDAIVARAHAVGDEPPVRTPVSLPSLDDARAAARDPADARRHHPFPTCFGCGPDRDPADAVRLLPGPVSGRPDLHACTWIPPTGLPAATDGALAPAVVWTALDCPSAAAAVPLAGVPHVLGRITGRLLLPVRVGVEHVILSWPTGHEGRKRWAEVVILGPDGALCASARALWIALREPSTS